MRTSTFVLQIIFFGLPFNDARLGSPKKQRNPKQAYLVKLSKEHEVLPGGTLSEDGFGYFVTNVSLGTSDAQQVRLALDLSGQWTWALSTLCDTALCNLHQRFQVSDDETLQEEEWVKHYVPDSGEVGEKVRGHFISEEVCIGKGLSESHVAGSVCAEMRMVAVKEMYEGSIIQQRFDGLLGLAVPTVDAPRTNFLGRLSADLPNRQFGFYASDDGKSAELLFGGYDRSRLESDVTWVPLVRADRGAWMIGVHGITVGTKRLDVCRRDEPCFAMVQVTAPEIAMNYPVLETVQEAISAGRVHGEYCNLPELSFELANGASLSLGVHDYAGAECKPAVRGMDLEALQLGAETMLFGEPLFRRYYVVFDWEVPRMGFARAKVERHCGRLGKAGLPRENCADVDEIVLLQTGTLAEILGNDGEYSSMWSAAATSSWWGFNEEA